VDIANPYGLNFHDADRVLRCVHDQILGVVLDFTESHLLSKGRPNLGERRRVHYHLHANVNQFMEMSVSATSQEQTPFRPLSFMPFLQEGHAFGRWRFFCAT
jgi:hypothetical protein